jgi:hypothetical protein
MAAFLMRRSHATGQMFDLKVGWYETKVDAYFLALAILLGDVLKTDKAIRQLKNALADHLYDRKRKREDQHRKRRQQPAIRRAHEQAISWALDG